MLTKKCSKCDEIKELVYFPPKGAICRQCHCQRAKEWYKVNKEKKKEYDAQYRKHNLEKLSKYYSLFVLYSNSIYNIFHFFVIIQNA